MTSSSSVPLIDIKQLLYKDDGMAVVNDDNSPYSFEDVCIKLGIDTSDDMTRYCLMLDILKEYVIDEHHLDIMKFTGKSFKDKQKIFKNLLQANPHIKYTRIRDGHNFTRKYYVLRGWDIETIYLQLKGELCDIITRLRQAFKIYWEYKQTYYNVNQ